MAPWRYFRTQLMRVYTRRCTAHIVPYNSSYSIYFRHLLCKLLVVMMMMMMMQAARLLHGYYLQNERLSPLPY
jgi:hypothetical protein